MSVGILLVVVFVIAAAFSGSSIEDPDLNNIVGSRLSGDVRSSSLTGNDTFNESNILREPIKYFWQDLFCTYFVKIRQKFLV